MNWLKNKNKEKLKSEKRWQKNNKLLEIFKQKTIEWKNKTNKINKDKFSIKSLLH